MHDWTQGGTRGASLALEQCECQRLLAAGEDTVPTYTYACTECDEQLEVVQSFTADPLTQCPRCDGRLRKVFHPVGVVFKGSGFYRTDSRSGSKAANGAGGSSEKSGTGAKGDAGSTSGESGSSSSGTSSEKSGSHEKSTGGSSSGGSSGSGSSGSGSSGKGSSGGSSGGTGSKPSSSG